MNLDSIMDPQSFANLWASIEAKPNPAIENAQPARKERCECTCDRRDCTVNIQHDKIDG